MSSSVSRRYSSRHGLVPQAEAELPVYTRRNTLSQPILVTDPTEHLFHLADGKARPWLSLKVLSSARSSKQLPTFFERENVTGSVQLDLEKGDSIQAVTVSVTGQIITGAGASDSFTFLDRIVTVWSKSVGDHRTPSPEGERSKLQGIFNWPFSIPLPKAVNVTSRAGETPKMFHLPETFLERHTKASVQYELTVRILRGKLRPNSHIKTGFGYIPTTRPDPPSYLRQIAYRTNGPLPGPDVDPQGWKTLETVTAGGTVFCARRTDARCTLSLASPLCYTRGTAIPCALTIESRDAQLLDLLSTPSSITVCLKRRVQYLTRNLDSYEDVSSAVWWPSGQEGTQSCRKLEGEIRLPKDMKPSSAMGLFSLTYSVVMCPFEAAGFASDDTGPLLAEVVEIATKHAKGPRQKTYSPPAYEPLSRPGDDTFTAKPRLLPYAA